MSLTTFCYSVYTVLVVVFCCVVGQLSKYRKIFSRRNLKPWSRSNNEKGSRRKRGSRDESRSVRFLLAGTNEKVHEGEIERAKSGAKKGKGSLNADKGPERLSCRHKIEVALHILLQAVELDNAGSLEAVEAYKEAAKLFDDAIEIVNNEPWKPTRVAVETSLKSVRDTFTDRADALLLEFHERVLSRKF